MTPANRKEVLTLGSKEKLYLSVPDPCPSKKMGSSILKSLKGLITCHKQDTASKGSCNFLKSISKCLVDGTLRTTDLKLF